MPDPRPPTRGPDEAADAGDAARGDELVARRADLAGRTAGPSDGPLARSVELFASAIARVTAERAPATDAVASRSAPLRAIPAGAAAGFAPVDTAGTGLAGGGRISDPARPHERARERAAPRRADATRRDAEARAHALPTLGVVIPTLDEEQMLPRLLERLLDPERRFDPADRADAVIVADGDSADATRELAAAAGARVVRTARSRGVQLAAGAHALDTDVLLFLHADCYPERGALARVREAFAGGEVVATAMRQRIEGEGWFFRWVERSADLRSRAGLVWGDSALAVRRDAYADAGGFAPFEIFEDVDLSLRLRKLGAVRLLPGATLAVSARRWREEGALRCTLRNWMLCARFFCGADPRRLAAEYRPHASSP